MPYRLLACLPIVFLAACSQSGEKGEATATEAPALPPLVFTGAEGFRNAMGCSVKMQALADAYDQLVKEENAKAKPDTEKVVWLIQAAGEKSIAHSPYYSLAVELRPNPAEKSDAVDVAEKAEKDLIAKERNARPPKDFLPWLEKETARCPLPPPGT